MTMEELPSCPLCDAPAQGEPFYSRPFSDPEVAAFIASYYGGRVPAAALAGHPFRIERCAACDFYWHRFVLDAETAGRFYDEWIDPEASRRKQTGKTPAERLVLTQRLARLLAVAGALARPSPRVLDVGGGWGVESQCAVGLGCEAILLESSAARVESARARGIAVAGSLADVAPGSVDLVVMSQSLEHIPRPRALLAELVPRLRPGGAIAIDVPRADPAHPVLAKGPFQPLEHVNGFTERALHGLLTGLGLRLARDYVTHAALGLRPLAGALRRNLRLALGVPVRPGPGLAAVATRPA